MRALRHLLIPDWWAFRAFPGESLSRIEEAIRRSETGHRGELRFVVEAGVPPQKLRLSPRERAMELFAELGVWDTEENSGVLLYVQLLDRDIEIVADRGIAAQVPQSEWQAVCTEMEAAFRAGRYEAGALAAIERVSTLLRAAFPARDVNPNELPDRPVRL